MALSQGTYQKLLQKLTPQQIQLMKLIVIPSANLEERITQELEENPALEQMEDDGDYNADKEELKDEFDTSDEEDFDLDGGEADYENIDISEYVNENDDDVADYKTKGDSNPEFDYPQAKPLKVENGLQEYLTQQLHMQNFSENKLIIAEQIIGTLDDDGYLRRPLEALLDDLAFRQNIVTNIKEVEEVLKTIQKFDPTGIAARDLQECLLIQLKKNDAEKNEISNATKIIEKQFEEFYKKHYEKIKKKFNITDAELRVAISDIMHLNPKPGGIIDESSNSKNYIIPDFFVINNNGELEITLNSINAPELKISEGYKEMLLTYDKGSKNDKQKKEAVVFIKQKIDAAKGFIDSIKQRQNTLMLTMQAIVGLQNDFFITGNEGQLKPMILKDVANVTGFDISTISRVANSKYVQTEFGNFKLKFFFSESIQTDSGEEVSTREVKQIIIEYINTEDKTNPITDEQLTDLLVKKGYNIARRTVAKYRELLNFQVARLRKIL